MSWDGYYCCGSSGPRESALERALRQVREAASRHPYDTRTRAAFLSEAESKALNDYIETLRRERSQALDTIYDLQRAAPKRATSTRRKRA